MKKEVLCSFFFLYLICNTTQADIYESERQEMVRVIKRHSEGNKSFFEKGKMEPKVLEAMGKIERHQFVPKDLKGYAYSDRPLPIGYGQTISQPYIVALMTDLLNIKENDKVLEIGTGSGYQAAVLSPLAKDVYTIEIIPPLGKEAKKKFEKVSLTNITSKVADGYYGWKEKAPFDAIVVTAAASHVPPPLIKQLKVGGRMVIPVGNPFSVQYLMIVEKNKKGDVKTTQVLPVRFVPFTGKMGQ
ncbi:MAG: protein-L-isoaspartate O-methyltransferase [Halobacteriovoraceae bacterium]|nr:protein-L-isoaspartate O-methyltransferase [Halobacteriovoraceae bacterium]